MRKKIVAGNWKMNLNKEESLKLVEGISNGLGELSEHTEVIVSPPFINIPYVLDSTTRNQKIEVAAQTMHHKEGGAYTGEISADMLKNIGINTVILGHSERREYFKESHEMLAEKVNVILENGLLPIFCCGEALAIREANTYVAFVGKQLKDSLFHLSADILLLLKSFDL